MSGGKVAWTIAQCWDPQPLSVGMEVASVGDEASWGQMKGGKAQSLLLGEVILLGQQQDRQEAGLPLGPRPRAHQMQ